MSVEHEINETHLGISMDIEEIFRNGAPRLYWYDQDRPADVDPQKGSKYGELEYPVVRLNDEEKSALLSALNFRVLQAHLMSTQFYMALSEKRIGSVRRRSIDIFGFVPPKEVTTQPFEISIESFEGESTQEVRYVTRLVNGKKLLNIPLEERDLTAVLREIVLKNEETA